MGSPASTANAYFHYQHTDACSVSRWTAKESYQFMHARPWQKVNDFYLDVVNGRRSLSEMFGKELMMMNGDRKLGGKTRGSKFSWTCGVHYGAEAVEYIDKPELGSQNRSGRSGRWARVTFKILLSYHGSSFDGWQKQPGLNTVQALIERCLGKFVDEKRAQLLKEKKLPIDGCVVVAGRTDKGVTAFQQVCSFYTWRTDVKALDIENAINDAAPGKIRVISVSQVSHGNIGPPTECFVFHARAAEAHLLCRKMDGTNTRTMCIELVANRFLRKMVRVLVATAIREAAAGAAEDALLKLMDATCRRATAPPAPPDGLCLVDVGYTEFDEKSCLIP
ncbi:hypothetical protein OROHE_006347 [Orobanche hederae]